jgi:TonB family protein
MFAVLLMLIATTANTPTAEQIEIWCSDGTISPKDARCPPQAMPLQRFAVDPPKISRAVQPIGNPSSWVTTNDYPSRALRDEREGTVGFVLTVSADGRALDCRVNESSGSADLDQATCLNMIRRARFNPALNTEGQPIKAIYANRVTWRIPDFGTRVSLPVSAASFPRGPIVNRWTSPPLGRKQYPAEALARKEDGVVYVDQEISASGSVISCTIAPNSGPVSLHAKSCEIAKSWTYTPAYDVNGNPTKGKVRHAFTWELPGPLMEYGGDEQGGYDEVIDTEAMDDALRLNIFDKSGDLTLKLFLDANGKLSACSVDLKGEVLKYLATMPEVPSQDQFDQYCMDELGKDIARDEWLPFIDKNGVAQPRVVTIKASLTHAPPEPQ